MRKSRNSSYRFIRNGFYRESPLYRSGRDLELFSALLYVHAVLEADIPAAKLNKQPGIQAAREVLGDAGEGTQTVIALQESSYLRARLLYIYKNLAAAARSDTALTRVLRAVEFDSFRQSLQEHIPWLARILRDVGQTSGKTLTTSGRLGGDIFRLPHTTDPWASSNAQDQFRLSMNQSLQFRDTPIESVLGPQQTVLLSSPLIPMVTGKTPSAAEPVHEFLHFAVPLSTDDWQALNQYDDASLTTVIVLHAVNSRSHRCGFFPVPCVCELRPRNAGDNLARTLFVRCNCIRVLENAKDICLSLLGEAGTPHLQVFVLGLRSFLLPQEAAAARGTEG